MPTETPRPLSSEVWVDRIRSALGLDDLPRRFEPNKSIYLTQMDLTGTPPDIFLTIKFVDDRNQGTTFGWRQDVGAWLREMPEYAADDPEWVAEMVWANFLESIADARDLRAAVAEPGYSIKWL